MKDYDCNFLKLTFPGQGIFESVDGEGVSADHASLNNPPPTYEEVINSNLYPPTPEAQRSVRIVMVFSEMCIKANKFDLKYR